MNSTKAPKITVLMPVYNCELYIKEAIDSILNQTFTDFEFLIIDDASTDETVSVIKEYKDSRIKLIEKPVNTGYTNSLNYGLKEAKGEYIARMDGDDISLPERFAKQVAFLDSNPDVILCGTLYQIIGTDKICNHPLTHEEIKVKLISGCYIAHPTVMFRKVTFYFYNLEYDPNMEPAEDYDLWTRIVFLGEMANIGEVLLYYRVHSQQTSKARSERQGKISRELRNRMLQKVVPTVNFKFHSFDLDSKLDEKGFHLGELQSIIKTIDYIIIKNNEKAIFDQTIFSKEMFEEKEYLCRVLSAKSNRYSFINIINVLYYFPSFFVIVGIKKSVIFIGRNLFFKIKNEFLRKRPNLIY